MTTPFLRPRHDQATHVLRIGRPARRPVAATRPDPSVFRRRRIVALTGAVAVAILLVWLFLPRGAADQRTEHLWPTDTPIVIVEPQSSLPRCTELDQLRTGVNQKFNLGTEATDCLE